MQLLLHLPLHSLKGFIPISQKKWLRLADVMHLGQNKESTLWVTPRSFQAPLWLWVVTDFPAAHPKPAGCKQQRAVESVTLEAAALPLGPAVSPIKCDMLNEIPDPLEIVSWSAKGGRFPSSFPGHHENCKWLVWTGHRRRQQSCSLSASRLVPGHL